MTPWLTIIGVGEGGLADLPAAARRALAAAKTVLGPERLLAGLTPHPSSPATGEVLVNARCDAPSFPKAQPDTSPLAGEDGWGVAAAELAAGRVLISWTPPLVTMLDQLDSFRNTPTAILATGDPMWFGIGATLAKRLPAEEFEVHAAPSAFQLAAARLRWPLQHLATISLHGRAVETVQPHVLPGNRILALTSDRSTLPAVAEVLVRRGYGGSLLTVLENLGGAAERIRTGPAAVFDAAGIGDFYTLAIDCVADSGAALLPPVPGLPDEAFMSDGQLTKREVRAATLAKLAPHPGALLWDVGAGCGSVAIEWLRAARDAGAIAFERETPRREMIAANAQALGTPKLAIIGGEAPASLAGQPSPDAIFLGGDVGNPALFDACWSALKPGGRFVANAVTLDGEAALHARQAKFGGDLTRLDISVLDSVGCHRVMRPRLPVTQWLAVKP